MDLIITIATVILLISMILGSLRRGIQRFVSFAVLFIVATLGVIRVSAGSLASSNLVDNNQQEEAPMVAIKAFDDFTQASDSYVNRWIATQEGGSSSLANQAQAQVNGSEETDVFEEVTPDNTVEPETSPGNATTGRSGTNPNSGAQGSVRAWW